MTSDNIDLNSLLQTDSNKFLNNLKESYLNILDVGVNDCNKQDIKRSFDSLKSLSGIFELNDITNFIIDVERILSKIIDAELPFLTNDILNDLFIVKDQIDKLFRLYWEKNQIFFDKKTIKENEKCLKTLNIHLEEYLKKSKPIKNEYNEKEEVKDYEEKIEDIYLQNEILVFKPKSLTHQNINELKDNLLEKIEECKSIDVELFGTNEIDTAGIQLIISIKNYCLNNKKNYKIKSISNLVEKKLELLGVSL